MFQLLSTETLNEMYFSHITVYVHDVISQLNQGQERGGSLIVEVRVMT